MRSSSRMSSLCCLDFFDNKMSTRIRVCKQALSTMALRTSLLSGSKPASCKYGRRPENIFTSYSKISHAPSAIGISFDFADQPDPSAERLQLRQDLEEFGPHQQRLAVDHDDI